MNENDRAEFKSIMEDVGACYGKEITPLLGTYWRVLAPRVDVGWLRGAMDAHMADHERGTYFPRPADILAQIAKAMPHDGYLSADEAWSLALRAMPEESTIPANNEILAARNLAQPIFDSGDEIGARMAFRAAYTRLVDTAKKNHQRPHWFISGGGSKEEHAAIVRDAVASGLIPRAIAKHFLPPPPPAGIAAGLAGLLTGKTVSVPTGSSDIARTHVAKMLASLTRKRSTPSSADGVSV